MVNYWTSKVLPKIKKVFENPKKVAAAEACKTFDEAKEEYSKEFEDKKTELQPKVIEIYEASTTEIKGLVKERKGSSLKKHAAAVEKFLDELAKIEFPGSKALCESAIKLGGTGYLGGPVSFVLEKVSTFIVVEEKKEPEEAPAPEGEVTATAADETVVKEKEIVVEHEPTATAEEVKPEEAVKVEETKAPSPEETKAPTTVECVPEAVEPPKP